MQRSAGPSATLRSAHTVLVSFGSREDTGPGVQESRWLGVQGSVKLSANSYPVKSSPVKSSPVELDERSSWMDDWTSGWMNGPVKSSLMNDLAPLAG